MKKIVFMLLVPLFFMLHFFLFPRYGGKELFWYPEKVVELSSIKKGNPFGEALLFNRGKGYRARFFTDDTPPFILAPEEDGLLSDEYCLRTSRGHFIMERLADHHTVELSIPGQPFTRAGHWYGVDAGSFWLAELDPRGQILWERWTLGPITAFGAGKNITASASVNGFVQLFCSGKEPVYIDLHSGSEPLEQGDCLVYGLAMDPGEEKIAVVHGRQPQMLKVYNLNAPARPVFEYSLKNGYSRPVKLFYDKSGNFLYVEQEGGVLQISSSGREIFLPGEGSLLWVDANGKDGFVAIIRKTKDNTPAPGGQFYIYSVDGALLYTEPFKGQLEDFVSGKESYYFLVNGTIHELGRRQG